MPKRRKETTPEEFSLAKRIPKLRTLPPTAFFGRDAAFVSAILARCQPKFEGLPQ